MKKLRMVLIIILCIFLTGCFNKKEEIVLSELSQHKNHILNKISNYTYTVNIDTVIDDKDVTLELKCQNDLTKKIGYCYNDHYYYDIEEYVFYGKRIYSYRNIYPDRITNWETLNRYSSSNINHWYNLVDLITNLRKETKEDGIYYTGIITSVKALAIVLQEADYKINTDYISSTISSVPIMVYINNLGYIEKIETELGDNEKVRVLFNDFDTTEEIKVPKELQSNY